MDGIDHPSVFGDDRSELAGVQALVVADVNEDRLGATKHERGDGRDERVRHGDYLVAGTNVEVVRQMSQAVGAVARLHRVLRPVKRGQVGLEVDQLLSQHQVPAGDGFLDHA